MVQFDLFGNPEASSQEEFKIQNGEYIYIPKFFPKIEADNFLNVFEENIEWRQEEMFMYGKKIKFPRLTAWYGESDRTYSFSGIVLQPHLWNTELLSIKEKIEPKCKTSFNSVLLNLYRNGNDSISWHTDAEKELGKNPVIASVNFGAERVFQLKHKETGERIDLTLEHGSLLIMKGELQHYWKHQLPKTKKKLSKRINLTFRVIKS